MALSQPFSIEEFLITKTSFIHLDAPKYLESNLMTQLLHSLCWVFTIHKKNICSRQKYPRLLGMLPCPVFHAGHDYQLHFKIEATFHALFHFFYYSFIFFLFIFKLLQISSRITQHLVTKTSHLQVRCFCFCLFIPANCRAKNTQNEKWPPFGGRCFNKAETNIFEIPE